MIHIVGGVEIIARYTPAQAIEWDCAGRLVGVYKAYLSLIVPIHWPLVIKTVRSVSLRALSDVAKRS